MSKRSQWCEFDRETRKYIKKRDNNECVICGSKNNLQIMHIFLSRAKGGKGCKENGCLGCEKCHKVIDNPIGKNQNELSDKNLQYCKEYLIKQENIQSVDKLIDELKYKKQIIDLDKIVKEVLERTNNRCKHCIYVSKTKYSNNSIGTYYCKLNRKMTKKNNTCKNFKN